ncbi:MAG: hypothetical protein JO061_21790 [Acidobacteriaceae bacterium]|nr:hypothetical protein [Acidobacteriaceae bacterium]
MIETELLDDLPTLRLILVHEYFHFVWPRLGNRTRRAFEAVLRKERARGELGESAAVRKKLACADARHWKDYVCESFCDTAAWMYAGVAAHPSFTLSRRWQIYRAKWFRTTFGR